MVPPDLVTIRLDLGWNEAEQAGMFAAEAYVSASRELLALEVHPVRHYQGRQDWLSTAQRWQAEIIRAVYDPDPF